MLVEREGQDIAKAVLPSMQMAHPRAAATLLEGFSLWLQSRLGVVLVVDERVPSSDATALYDALGYGESTVHYDIGIATALRGRRRRYVLEGVGDFRDLRRARWEVVR